MFKLDATSLDSIVRVIQLSLTPIFLLTAVANLLSVFTARLARISDHVDALSALTSKPDAAKPDAASDEDLTRRLQFLRRRSHALDIAVVLGALAGASTCGTALSLFLGLLRSKATVTLLFVLFGTALLCTIGALAAFLSEVLLASRGLRADVVRHVNNIGS